MNSTHVARVGFISLFSFLLLVSATTVSTTAFLSSGTSPQQQLQDHDVFTAELGAAPGVNTNARGIAVFWLSNNAKELHYILIVQDIRNVFMAHIHLDTGSILVWLYPNPRSVRAAGQTNCLNVLSGGKPSACSGYIPGEFNGELASGIIKASNLKSSDCAGCNGFTFSQMISAIESGSAFVNVHTVQNPAGEIQGTITEL